MKNNYVIVGRERTFLKFIKYAIMVLLPLVAFLVSYIAFNVTITGPVVWFKTFVVCASIILVIIAVVIFYIASDWLKLTYDGERVDVDGQESKTIDIA